MLVYQRVYVFHLFHFDVVLELPLIFGISEQIFRHAVHQIFGHCGQATRLLLKTDGRSERKQITINYLCLFKKFRFWRNACCYRLPSGIMFSSMETHTIPWIFRMNVSICRWFSVATFDYGTPMVSAQAAVWTPRGPDMISVVGEPGVLY